MKKIFFAIFIPFALILQSQNREIAFEHGNMASVLEKAKKENKLIFVDAYTTWCGPCKWLAKNVFTNDTVADYFNQTFVNYKLDMEKGEGLEFAKKFEVNCYPTLLFIDMNGNLVNRKAGGLPVAHLMDYAKSSLIPEKTFVSEKKKLESEGINESNIINYVHLLSWNCLDVSAPIKEYLKTVKDEDLIRRNNWIITRDYINDPASREIKYLLAHLPAFEKTFGKDTVNMKLAKIGGHYFDKFHSATEFNKQEFEKAKQEFLALNWPESKKIIYTAELNLNRRFNKSKFYEMAAADYLSYYNNSASELNSIAWVFYTEVTDKKQLKAAVDMAKRACELSPEYAHLDTYAAVLYKHDDYKEAEKMAIKAIESAKKNGDDAKDTEELLKKIKEKMNG